MKHLNTKEEFDAFLAEAGDKLVVIDFTATWCGPCKMIGPKFEELAKEFANGCFAKVDVDDNAETAESEGISAMPTFKFYKNGKKLDDILQGANEGKLRELIQKNV